MSGILLCGVCSTPMRYKRAARQADRYVCIKNPGEAGCGKVSIAKPDTDRFIADVLLHRVGMLKGLDREGAIDVEARRTQLQGALDQDREAMRALAREPTS